MWVRWFIYTAVTRVNAYESLLGSQPLSIYSCYLIWSCSHLLQGLSALPQRNPSACSPPAAPRGRCYQWGWESPAWWQREHWEKPTGLWLSRMLKTMALKGVFAGHQIPRPTYPWRPGPTFLARNLSTFSWGFKSKGFQDWAQSTYNQSFFLFKCLQTVTPVPKALLQEK